MKASGKTGPRARGPRGAAVLVLPLVVYGLFAARRISAGIGYQMDEALYVESAVYVLADGRGDPPFAHDPAFFLAAGGRRWPIMVFPYVGAFKAWVALPLFAALGTGAAVARSSGALLGALGIAGFVRLLAEEASPAAALVTGLALAIQPGYLDLTVFDHGGTSVWMAAMGLLAFALARFLRRRSPRSASLLGVAAGLGVWARVNFVWLLAAAALAAAIVYGRRARPAARELAAAAAGGLLGALPLLVYEAASHGGTLTVMETLGRLPAASVGARARLSLLAELMISSRQLRPIWGGPGTRAWEVALGGALLAAACAGAFLPGRGGDARLVSVRRALAWTALLLSGILAFSRLPVGQHHMAAVLPPGLAALSILAAEAWPRSPAARALAAGAGAALAAVWLSWDARIDRGLRETGGRGFWSSASFDAARALEERSIPPAKLKLLDWGFQNPFYVVSGGRIHGTELFWGATAERSARGRTWGDEIGEGGAFLEWDNQPPSASVRAFRDALAQAPAAAARETVFRDRSGAPAIRLVEISPAR